MSVRDMDWVFPLHAIEIGHNHRFARTKRSDHTLIIDLDHWRAGWLSDAELHTFQTRETNRVLNSRVGHLDHDGVERLLSGSSGT